MNKIKRLLMIVAAAGVGSSAFAQFDERPDSLTPARTKTSISHSSICPHWPFCLKTLKLIRK